MMAQARVSLQLQWKTRRALAIFRKKALVGGFGAWHENAAEDRRKCNIIERIVIRMTSRRLTGAMWRWFENVMELRTSAAIDLKVVARWKKKAVAMCVDSWQKYTLEKVRKQTKIKRTISSLLNTISCWREKAIVNCVESWHFYVATQMRKRNAMKRAVRRKLYLRLSGAIVRWCEGLQERARVHAKIRKARSIWLNKVILICFGDWHEHAAEETRKRNIMDTKTRKALAIWRKKALAGGFGAWHEHAAEETRKCNIMDRIAIKMMNRRLSGAMWRWCENLQERVRMDAKNKKALSIWRHTALVFWFGGWHEHAAEETRERNIMDARTQKALAIWRHKALAGGFGVWHEHAAEEMRNRSIMEANTLNDEIVFIKKRNDKLQRSVMKMEEQRCRLGDELAFKLLRRTTEKIFASWSIMACVADTLKQ
jgi:hypothetical protein